MLNTGFQGNLTSYNGGKVKRGEKRAATLVR